MPVFVGGLGRKGKGDIRSVTEGPSPAFPTTVRAGPTSRKKAMIQGQSLCHRYWGVPGLQGHTSELAGTTNWEGRLMSGTLHSVEKVTK